MISTGLGNLMTQVLMLAFGLILLVPCAYKLTTYIVFRNQSIAVNGIIDMSSRGMELGGRPFVEYKDLQGNVHTIKSKAKTHWFYGNRRGHCVAGF